MVEQNGVELNDGSFAREPKEILQSYDNFTLYFFQKLLIAETWPNFSFIFIVAAFRPVSPVSSFTWSWFILPGFVTSIIVEILRSLLSVWYDAPSDYEIRNLNFVKIDGVKE